MQILQYLINGIALGSVYALIATGFSLIFNVLKFSNFSHGALMTLSAFAGYFIAASNGWGLVPTILVAVVTGSVVALLGEFVAFRRILIRNTSPIYFFVSSITLGTLFEGIVVLQVGANFFNYPRFFGKPLRLGSLIISQSDIIIFCISAFVLIVLAIVIQKPASGARCAL